MGVLSCLRPAPYTAQAFIARFERSQPGRKVIGGLRDGLYTAVFEHGPRNTWVSAWCEWDDLCDGYHDWLGRVLSHETVVKSGC